MSKDEALLKRINENYSSGVEAFREFNKLAEEDLAFLEDSNQWDAKDKQKRGNLPCLVVNKVSPLVDSLTNEYTQNKTSIIYRPTDTKEDAEIADVMSGLIKHIQQKTNASAAYTAAYKQCLICGLAYLRVTTEYKNSRSFDQDYKIECLESPFNAVIDPTFQALDGSDIEWAFVLSDITEDKYKQLFGEDAPKANTYTDTKPIFTYAGSDLVRIAEYYEKVYKPIVICELADGRVVKESQVLDPSAIIQKRKSYETEIQYYKTDGVSILEESVWPGTFIPVIPVLGNYVIEEGKRKYRGIVRNCKTAQRSYNWWSSALAEMISASATSPWIVAEGSLVDEQDWVGGSKKAVLKYHAMDLISQTPFPPPQRNAYEAPIQSILAALATAEEALKAVTNLYDPSLGKRTSDNQSGIAIARLQSAGQTSNYHYIESMNSAIRIIGQIIFETLPVFYNSKRVTKVIGQDDKERTVTLVPEGPGDPVNKIFSLDAREYDIVVDSGPGYSTKRQENIGIMMEMAKIMPQIGQVAPDIIASQLDTLIADKLSKRLKRTVPQQLLDESDNEDAKQESDVSPEVIQELEKNKSLIQEQANTINELSKKVELEQYSIDSKERIALLDAETKLTIEILKLGNVKPAIKLQSEIDQRQEVLNAEDPTPNAKGEQSIYTDPFLKSLAEEE